MNHLAKLSSKGQITIPLEVRRHLGLKQGDQVSFEFEDGRTIIKPYRSEENPFLQYQGALKSFKTVEEINSWLSDIRDNE